ncbi:MAG: bifunctional UDP-sugar hydrolase/5'-nucleotidase [Paenisporosarcina sp.]
MIETIHFYHTNDLHSHFQHWPRIHELLTSRRKWHLEEGEASFAFDIGDHIDRSHIYTEGTLGKGNTLLLNEAMYNVVTIGNNEGITLPHDDLESLYDDANFEVVVGNLFNKNGTRPNWVKPYLEIQTTKGTKIGIVAVTAEFSSFYECLDWKVTPAFEALRESLHHLTLNADIIVCLSHLGIHEDEKMASHFPEIDVIFGAHTHHVLHEGKLVDDVLLAAAGKFGQFVGHVTVDFDLEKKEIKKKRAQLYDSNELPPVPQETHKVAVYEQIGKDSMKTLEFFQNDYLEKDWFQESALSNYFGEAMLNYCDADCALFNAGIFLDDLKSGWVSSLQVHQILPHPINPCLIELTHLELIDIYNQSLNQEWPNLEIKGLGFRGSVMGKMIAYNMRVVDNELYIQNEPVNSNKIIRLATLDMFTFGYFFPNLKNVKKTYFMPDFLRDVFIWYGKSQK